MVNYILILTLISLLSLCLTIVLAIGLLRWVARPRVDCVPATIAQDLNPSGVISYAHAENRPSLLARYPVLLMPFAALLGGLPTIAVAAIPLYPPGSTMRAVFSTAGIIGMVVYSLACIAVIAAGLRPLSTSLPRATRWRIRRPLAAAGVCLVLLLTTLGLMHWQIRTAEEFYHRQSEHTLEQFPHPSSPGGQNAIQIYAQASTSYAAGTDMQSLKWIIDVGKRLPNAPPPAFPQNQIPTIRLVQQGAAMQADIGDPTTIHRYYNCGSIFRLLQLHAIGEAQADRFDEAMKDIVAIQAMAGHIGQDPAASPHLFAIDGDSVACQTMVAILPFTNDAQQLAHLPLRPRSWYRELGQYHAKYYRAIRLHWLSDGMNQSQARIPILSWKRLDYLFWTLTAPGELAWVDRQLAAIETCEQTPTDAQWARSLMAGYKQLGISDPWAPISSCDLGRGQMDVYGSNLEGVRALVQRDLTAAAIAATRYRLKTGALPQSWDDLQSAGMISEIPVDLETGSCATLVSDKDQTSFLTGGSSFRLGTSVGTCAATRPLWEIFGKEK